MKKWLSFLLIFVMLTLCLASCDNGNKKNYNTALELLDEGKYEEAYNILVSLGDYKDAPTLVKRFRYIPVEIKCTEEYEDGKNDLYTLRLNENNLPLQLLLTESDSGQSVVNFTFDNEGRLVKVVTTYSDGHQYTDEYTHDTNGKVTQKILTYDDGSKGIEKYYYDANGNLVQEISTSVRGEQTVTDYTYDANGVLIKEVYTYSDGDKFSRDYTYDANGNLIKKAYASYYGYGTKEVFDYTYDVNGKLIKEVYTIGSKKTIIDYTYDINGNIIKKVETYSSVYTDSFGDSYDKDYRQIKSVTTYAYSNGESNRNIYEYFYDTNGNLVKSIHTSSFGSITEKYRFRFVYVPFDITDEEWEELWEYFDFKQNEHL